jgi:hypothetical protein
VLDQRSAVVAKLPVDVSSKRARLERPAPIDHRARYRGLQLDLLIADDHDRTQAALELVSPVYARLTYA